ncbi:amidohydrolase family protein [Kordiimonas pumila]|uniref:Amidohydrolase family protein n=1 Tax=Kordiimonas pumila TaxID=2161677 RepID=A0ABV7D4L6_9PROT|nr:amidohydrolase family protein [Kordiimonas pumila]
MALHNRFTAVLAGLLATVSFNQAGVAADAVDAGKNLQFTTDQATWMSLDVSPNGKEILVDVLGDIYTLDVRGGAAKPVLTGKAFEGHPVFSPDGKKFAFISDRDGSNNLWIANVDGSGLKKLSHDDGAMLYASPNWSADGQYVYVSKAPYSLLAFEVFMFHVDGGAGVKLTKAQPNGTESFDDRTNALGIVASPDGRYVYYATKQGSTWSEHKLPHWSIVRRDLQTGVVDTIIPATGGAMEPALSHDGKKIVYASREGQTTGLRLRDLETGNDTSLIARVDRDGHYGGYYMGLIPRYAFTPDDKALILSVDGKIKRFDMAERTLTDIPFSVQVDVKLGSQTRVAQKVETGPVKARIIQAPKLSPDGRSIVFTALGQLYVMDLKDGAKPRRVAATAGDIFQPNWSPDGKSLVYVTWSAAEGGHVWSIAANGTSKPKQLTKASAYYTEPVVSPDGKAVVFLQASHYDRLRSTSEIWAVYATDIVQVPFSGGPSKLVLHAKGIHAPHFSTVDQNRIQFYGASGLSSVRLDGVDLRQQVSVTEVSRSQYTGYPVPVSEVRIRPQGDWALAKTSSSDLYLVNVPPLNGEAPVINLASPSVALFKLTDIGADYFDWAKDGEVITWSVGASFYQINLADIDFSKHEPVQGKADKYTAVVEIPRDVPEGVLVLRGATAITMKGDEIIENADVIVTNNRITAVGEVGSLAAPEGAEVLDITGKYIVPGFIDTHAHWFSIRRELLEKNHWNFLANLAYGVTSGLDVQTFTVDTFSYQDMIDAGMMLGPRAFSTGPGVFVNSDIHSKADAVNVLTRYRDYYRTRNIKAYMVGDREQRGFMLEGAREVGMMPTTEGASDLRLNLTHALDGFSGNEHNLPVTPIHKDVITLFAESRIAYTPTLTVLYGGPLTLDDMIIRHDPAGSEKLQRFMPSHMIESVFSDRKWIRTKDHAYPQFAADAIAIQRAGGLVGMGSHGEVQGLGYHWEMEAYASGGATPHEVLMAATIGSSEVIGRKDDLGSIEAGKLADMVILNENPLSDIKNTKSIEFVMKNGRLYNDDTLDEVWPTPKKLAPTWYMKKAVDTE